MKRPACQRRKEFNACPNLFRLKRIAESETKTEGREFYSPILKVNAVDLFQEALQIGNSWSLPLISAAPMEY